MSGIRRSAAFAAALSFIIPGLGQGLSGAIARGVLLALPVIVLVAGAALVLAQSSARIVGLLLDPAIIVGLLVLNGVLLLYRSASIIDAYLVSRRLQPQGSVSRLRRTMSAGVLLALLAATVTMHAGFGVIGMKTYVADARLFSMTGPDEAEPESSLAPISSAGGTIGPSPTPAVTPEPLAPWRADGRLNILLVGGDAGPGRWSLRTDTMVLASVDAATGRTAFFGIPRNLINVPLGPASAGAFTCHCFPDLLNGLYVYAGKHPESFPGGNARGYLALQSAVSALTGAQVDGTLVVDLNGFVRLVNALGGITITVPAPVYDARYPLEDGSGNVPLYIKAGQQHMNGHLALAYARSRHQDDDYHRMERQQLVLLALRRAVKPCALVPRLPELIDIAGDSLWTNLSVHDMPDILALAQRVDTRRIVRYALVPPTIPEYLDARSVAKVHAMVANAFKALATSTPTPRPVPSLPGGPTPTPTPQDDGC